MNFHILTLFPDMVKMCIRDRSRTGNFAMDPVRPP